MRKALFYEKRGTRVFCKLCCHGCVLEPGEQGRCRVRQNLGGELFSLNYGKLVAEHVDPVEKKPLFHFLPGTLTYSIATVGCNFSCLHCQNYTISQLEENAGLPGSFRDSATVVEQAKLQGCRSISHTYVEPTVFFEYALDVSVLARAAGLKNCFVTNGYMQKQSAREIGQYLDGINLDIKGFTDAFYQEVTGARLKPVLAFLEEMKSLGVWVEVTTLLLPGKNDSRKELKELARYLASIDPDMVWHLTAFYPTYKMRNLPATSPAVVRRACRIGREAGLNHVYSGNLAGESTTTCCSACSAVLLERYGLNVVRNTMVDGKCGRCGSAVAGVWL